MLATTLFFRQFRLVFLNIHSKSGKHKYELNYEFTTTTNQLKEIHIKATFTRSEKKQFRRERRQKNNFQEIKTSQDDERNQFLISFPDSCAEWLMIVVGTFLSFECTLQSREHQQHKKMYKIKAIIGFQLTQCGQTI